MIEDLKEQMKEWGSQIWLYDFKQQKYKFKYSKL